MAKINCHAQPTIKITFLGTLLGLLFCEVVYYDPAIWEIQKDLLVDLLKQTINYRLDNKALRTDNPVQG